MGPPLDCRPPPQDGDMSGRGGLVLQHRFDWSLRPLPFPQESFRVAIPLAQWIKGVVKRGAFQ
eukprot:128620-Chlamydomonas_euryale.AAC.2